MSESQAQQINDIAPDQVSVVTFGELVNKITSQEQTVKTSLVPNRSFSVSTSGEVNVLKATVAMPMVGNVDGSTINVDWSKGNTQMVILGGNRTITWSNQADGQILHFLIVQDATGNRTLTWPATVSWPGGSAPALTVTANKADLILFIRDLTNNLEYGYVISKNYTCFLAGTLISTPGGQMPIERVKTGDVVLGINGPIRVSSVSQHKTDSYYSLTIDGEETLVTGEHPYIMEKGIKPVSFLCVGDKVKSLRGISNVEKIIKIQNEATVYSLTVDEPHLYIANGVYVHNKGSPS